MRNLTVVISVTNCLGYVGPSLSTNEVTVVRNFRVATSVENDSAYLGAWLFTNDLTLVRKLTVATSVTKSFSQSRELVVHKRIHTGDKP